MIKKRPRVFLVEEPKADLNLEPTARFGDLRFVFDSKQMQQLRGEERRRYKPSFLAGQLFCQRINERLEEEGFDPAYDYICLTGSTVAVSYLVSVVVQKYSNASALVYNSPADEYVLSKIGGLNDAHV